MNKRIFIIFITAFWAKPVFALDLREIAKLSNPIEQLKQLKKYNEERIEYNEKNPAKQENYLKIYEKYNPAEDSEIIKSKILSRNKIKAPSIDLAKEKEAAKEQLLKTGQEAAELMDSVAEQVATLKENSVLGQAFQKNQQNFYQYIQNLKDKENSIQNAEDLKIFAAEALDKIKHYKKEFQKINDALGSKANANTEFQQAKNFKDGKKLPAEEGGEAPLDPKIREMRLDKKKLEEKVSAMGQNYFKRENEIADLIDQNLFDQEENIQKRIRQRKKGQTGEERNTNPEMEKLLVNAQNNLSKALQKNSTLLNNNEKAKSEINEIFQKMGPFFQYISETTDKALDILKKTVRSSAFIHLETKLEEHSNKKNRMAPLFKLIQSDYRKFKDSLSSIIAQINFDGNENIDRIKEKLQKSEILKTEIEKNFSIYEKHMKEINNAIGLYNKNSGIMNVTSFITFLQNLIEGKSVESNTAANEKKVKEKGPVIFDVKKDENKTDQLIRCLKDAHCIKSLTENDVKKAFQFTKGTLETAYDAIKKAVSELRYSKTNPVQYNYENTHLGISGGSIKEGTAAQLSDDFGTILGHALKAFNAYHKKVAASAHESGSKKLSTEDRTSQLEDFKQKIKDEMPSILKNSQPV